MKLIAEKLGKADKMDRLRYVRSDGTASECAMPRQGTLPHDLIHYVIESQLKLKDGFTGLIARGAEPSFAMEVTHELAKKMVCTEAVQVEAIVEALQAQLWSGQFSHEDFLEGVRTACYARDEPTFPFEGVDAEKLLFDKVREVNATWMAVPFHSSMTLEFHV
jgi:hypothetical protein